MCQFRNFSIDTYITSDVFNVKLIKLIRDLAEKANEVVANISKKLTRRNDPILETNFDP